MPRAVVGLRAEMEIASLPLWLGTLIIKHQDMLDYEGLYKVPMFRVGERYFIWWSRKNRMHKPRWIRS